MPASYLAPSPSPATAVYSRRASAAAVFALTKPRLATMSVLTTMAAYATARPMAGPTVATLVGTSLAAAGALSLNQWWERQSDACMERTRGRPLPMRNISPGAALAWSVAFSVSGVALLAWQVNLAGATLATATILVYGVVYTPLKRRTRWATEIGSISGALPALLGNAAAGNLGSRPGLVLAAVLLFWQMPHFFAIGWRHRLDYRAAGFPLLPAVDVSGARTATWSLAYIVLLIGVSLAPWAMGWLGAIYGVPALFANAWFLHCGWQFLVASNRERAARRLFLASLIYLPLVMAGLIIEQLGSR
ncbi:MAG: Protoheme farnesyltransferase [Gemmatimonadota bacterium]